MLERSTTLIEALRLAALFTLAAGQPVYDFLSRHPEFLIAHQVAPIGLVGLVLVFSLLLPGALALVLHLIARMGLKYWKAAQLLTIFCLATLILMPPFKLLPVVPFGLWTGAAVLGGALFCWSYSRIQNVRSFVTWLCPAIVLAPALFLHQNPLLASGPPIDQTPSLDEIEEAPPIIFVVFDEFPVTSLMNERKEIDAERYPNFARLARQASWFRNATTVSDNTTLALPALLTGNYPLEANMPTRANYPNNLFALLEETYILNVFESASLMSVSSARPQRSLLSRSALFFFDIGIIYLHIVSPPKMTRTMLPPIPQAWRGFGDLPAAWMNQEWLKELEKDRRREWFEFVDSIPSPQESEFPSLNFLHVLLPHSPFQRLPTGTRYMLGPDSAGLGSGKWEGREETIDAYYRHLLQLGFVDTLLGSLIDRLEKLGLFDQSLIIVTADHGISFRTGDSPRALTATNVWDIISVPLFIKAPLQQQGRIEDKEVEIIDVLPTIASVLKIRLPWKTDGRAVTEAQLESRTRRVVSASESECLAPYQDELPRWYVFPSEPAAYRASLRRKIRLFGVGAAPDGFFHPSYAKPFVGRAIDSFRIDPAPGGDVAFDQPELPGSTLEREDFLLTRLSGRLRLADGGSPSNGPLLIAVNGSVRAAALVSIDGEFAAVLPEEAFSEPETEIRLFLLVEKEESGNDLLIELDADASGSGWIGWPFRPPGA